MKKLRVTEFSSMTPEYTKAFHTFLSHTDQKEKAMEWLEREIAGLRRRERAIDAGAGTGKLTKWLTHRFASVIGVEPNPLLAAELRATCPEATLLPDIIAAVTPGETADFVLCSHVFYYIPRTEWETTLRQLTSWLAPGGVLAIALGSPSSDCRRMLHYFTGWDCGLSELAVVFELSAGGPYDVRLDTVEAYVRTEDLQTACEVAEFMLNILPMPNPPLWAELEDYVWRRFRRSAGRYEFSCHQDFLRIARHA